MFILSTGGITGKKSNELIQGGISSLKYAATSVAKKFDEIKEAMSTNSTPVKGTNASLIGSEKEAFEEEASDGSGSYNIDGMHFILFSIYKIVVLDIIYAFRKRR